VRYSAAMCCSVLQYPEDRAAVCCSVLQYAEGVQMSDAEGVYAP